MNKFKKEKVLSEISKTPATRETVKTIIRTFNDLERAERDYGFEIKLMAKLGTIINKIYEGTCDISIIPNKLTEIKNNSVLHSPSYISREIVSETKRLRDSTIFSLSFINRSTIMSSGGNRPFRILPRTNESGRRSIFYNVFILRRQAIEQNFVDPILNKYNALKSKVANPRELIEKFSLFLKNMSTNEIDEFYMKIEREDFIPKAYKELGITAKEFAENIKVINRNSTIRMHKNSLERNIRSFKNPKYNSLPALRRSDIRRQIAMSTSRLYQLGEIDDWEPLFDYKVQKNRNKAYERYLKNKDKDGWCKLAGGIRTKKQQENVIVDMLVYTKQAEVEIRNKCKWVKITLH